MTPAKGLPLSWILDDYTAQSLTFGRPGIRPEHRAVAERIVQWCDLAPGSRILELGSGTGAHAGALAEAGHHVWGIEQNPSDAAHARHLATDDIGDFTPKDSDALLASNGYLAFLAHDR